MISIEMSDQEKTILATVSNTPAVLELQAVDPQAFVAAAQAELDRPYALQVVEALGELMDRRGSELDEALGALGEEPSIRAVLAISGHRALVEMKQRALIRALKGLDQQDQP